MNASGSGSSMKDVDSDPPLERDAAKLKIAELRRRNDRLHRSVLEKDVLQGLLPVRARTMEHRSAAPEARAREERFRAASASYREAVEDFTSFGESTRVTTLDTLSWWVPLTRPNDSTYVERYLRHQDFPYRALTQTREAALGGTMLDIGANVGRMSIPRVVLGDVVAAYCAEPDPLNYACLVRNVRDNHLHGLVLPDRLAIGSENGVVRLQRMKSAGGHRVLDAAAKTRGETIEVPSLTLDTWVDRLGIDMYGVSFVKVDAQGSELHVLRGAARTLAYRHVAWQLEVDIELLGRRGVAPEELLALLQSRFSHFVDLNREAPGDRVRPVGELPAALEYLSRPELLRTDVLLFTLEVVRGSER